MSQTSQESTPKTKASLRPLLALVPFMRPYRHMVMLAAVFLLVSTSATLFLPQSVGKMIDHGFSKADAQFVDRYFWMLLVVAVVLAVTSAARYYFVSRIGENLIADLRKMLYQKLLVQEQAFYESTKSGELISRLTTDTELVQTLIGSAVSVALRHSLMLIGALILLVLASPKLAALIIIGIPAVILPIFFIGKRVQKLSRDTQDRIAESAGVAGESLNAIHTVQAFAREGFEAQRYGSAVHALLSAAKRRIGARASLIALVILIVFGAITLIIWIGAKAVLAGTMTGGELTQFVLYAVVAAGATGALTEVWGDVQRAAGAMQRIAELLQRQSQIYDASHPVSAANLGSEIEFSGVQFSYPSRLDSHALGSPTAPLNLRIERGQTVALVGRSGAGKSTLFQLLLRFYQAQHGSISVGGVDIRQLSLQSLREHIALVPQDPVIFSGTIAENIAYGRIDASEDELIAAATAAEAMEFIRELPNGLQSLVGERGVRLSGGQQQRIAIARAILKNAPILLLDEATSALDAQSERAVQKALERLMLGRTTLVIAHRLSTVVRADRIVVMQNGQILDEGTHASLVAREGLYAELAKLQFDVVEAASRD